MAEPPSASRTLPANYEGTGAYCAVMFWILGGATAIMIARTRVMENITLCAKRSYDVGVRRVRHEKTKL